MAEKTNANIGFEKQLWDAACVLWGHIPAAEYRKVIIGLIFLRYISTAFEKRYNQLVAEGDGFEDDRDAYEEENIFFVPEAARWSTIAAATHTPEIGNDLLKQSIKSDGVINLFSDVNTEFSLFDPKFLEEISKMKEKNLAVELLKKLISEQVSIYRRTNIVKSEKFSEIMQRAMNSYLIS